MVRAFRHTYNYCVEEYVYIKMLSPAINIRIFIWKVNKKMKRNYLIQIAHDALQLPNKKMVLSLLDNTNLTFRERDIIEQTELNGLLIKELCDKYNMSFQGIMKIKTSGMLKIANHLQNSIQSINKVD